jgi:hypothetical protein
VQLFSEGGDFRPCIACGTMEFGHDRMYQSVLPCIHMTEQRSIPATFVLGCLGFSAAQQSLVAECLPRVATPTHSWRFGDPHSADAWLVNGSRCQVLADGSIRVGAPAAGTRSVRLSLDEVHRPIAFSEPLASREFEPVCRFVPGDCDSLQRATTVFESWLHPLAAQLAIAHWLVSRGEPQRRVYHVLSADRLLAVVVPSGDIGVAPGCGATDLRGALWKERPSSAADIPAGFIRVSVSEALWQYAVRTESSLLPPHYDSCPIYFRRPPKVSYRLVSDEHLIVLREVAQRPATLQELLMRTAFSPSELTRQLGALYLTGCITSKKWRAACAPQAELAEFQRSRNQSLNAELSDAEAAPKPTYLDMTVPLALLKC